MHNGWAGQKLRTERHRLQMYPGCARVIHAVCQHCGQQRYNDMLTTLQLIYHPSRRENIITRKEIQSLILNHQYLRYQSHVNELNGSAAHDATLPGVSVLQEPARIGTYGTVISTVVLGYLQIGQSPSSISSQAVCRILTNSSPCASSYCVRSLTFPQTMCPYSSCFWQITASYLHRGIPRARV